MVESHCLVVVHVNVGADDVVVDRVVLSGRRRALGLVALPRVVRSFEAGVHNVLLTGHKRMGTISVT